MPFMEKSSVNSKRSELGNTDRSRRTGRVLYALTYGCLKRFPNAIPNPTFLATCGCVILLTSDRIAGCEWLAAGECQPTCNNISPEGERVRAGLR